MRFGRIPLPPGCGTRISCCLYGKFFLKRNPPLIFTIPSICRSPVQIWFSFGTSESTQVLWMACHNSFSVMALVPLELAVALSLLILASYYRSPTHLSSHHCYGSSSKASQLLHGQRVGQSSTGAPSWQPLTRLARPLPFAPAPFWSYTEKTWVPRGIASWSGIKGRPFLAGK